MFFSPDLGTVILTDLPTLPLCGGPACRANGWTRLFSDRLRDVLPRGRSRRFARILVAGVTPVDVPTASLARARPRTLTTRRPRRTCARRPHCVRARGDDVRPEPEVFKVRNAARGGDRDDRLRLLMETSSARGVYCTRKEPGAQMARHDEDVIGAARSNAVRGARDGGKAVADVRARALVIDVKRCVSRLPENVIAETGSVLWTWRDFLAQRYWSHGLVDSRAYSENACRR